MGAVMAGVAARLNTAQCLLAQVMEHEQGYAALAILILRENGVSDDEILRHFTTPNPRADRAVEAVYHAESGVRVLAVNIKRRMRELLRH